MSIRSFKLTSSKKLPSGERQREYVFKNDVIDCPAIKRFVHTTSFHQQINNFVPIPEDEKYMVPMRKIVVISSGFCTLYD